MGSKTTLAARDGATIGAYLAIPEGKPKAGLVVLQEIFGVNQHIREVTDGFAAAGYLAIAPALFDRVERNAELGYAEADMGKARALRGAVDPAAAMLDIEAAVEAVASAGKVGVIGYCWGGTLAYAAAVELNTIDAAVGYYGSGVAAMADSKPRVPVILHFGEQDHGIPMSDVEKVIAARPDVPVYTYPAGHGFNCDHRASFDSDSAALALRRTLAFLDEKLA